MEASTSSENSITTTATTSTNTVTVTTNLNLDTVTTDDDLWIFAYGSLCWRPGFVPICSHPCYVVGFSRRFYQGSCDHRGSVSKPGRVVTLIVDSSTDSRCCGLCYRIAAQERNSVLSYLDEREQGGYSAMMVDCYSISDDSLICKGALTYSANPSNPYYLGNCELTQMARTIANSRGQSGWNRDYLFKLHQFILSLQQQDDHVSSLVQLVNQILNTEEQQQ